MRTGAVALSLLGILIGRAHRQLTVSTGGPSDGPNVEVPQLGAEGRPTCPKPRDSTPSSGSTYVVMLGQRLQALGDGRMEVPGLSSGRALSVVRWIYCLELAGAANGGSYKNSAALLSAAGPEITTDCTALAKGNNYPQNVFEDAAKGTEVKIVLLGGDAGGAGKSVTESEVAAAVLVAGDMITQVTGRKDELVGFANRLSSICRLPPFSNFSSLSDVVWSNRLQDEDRLVRVCAGVVTKFPESTPGLPVPPTSNLTAAVSSPNESPPRALRSVLL